ncbi:MAG: hypothetical protein E6J34_17145 [Chloroflexi bacterium]|nr:MAG: hypothetical protein E6J34_17145 [Chloroflexota bacterium]
MLDLTAIAVVDNHCHPILLKQQIDAPQLRRLFTEATSPAFAEQHMPNSVHYLWMLRQLAQLYHCAPSEAEILTARNTRDAAALLTHCVTTANIEALLLDLGYPAPEQCYTAEQMSQLAGCRTARILRLEMIMQQLIVSCNDIDEVIERFTVELSELRQRGYCALKSVVAYRTGLYIAEWSKDDAAIAFAEARAQAVQQGYIRIAHKPLLDYLLHIAFKQAAQQRVPLQFHTGYGDHDTDMRLGNPLHLRDILERRDYQTMPVVLLHESYPYSQLGAYLAAIYPHVYLDLSYTIPFVDKLEMLSFTRQALSVAPASKLMYSTDGIYLPEMYWLGAQRGRAVIGQVLQEMIDADEIDTTQAHHLAKLVLHDTATQVYTL